MITSRMMLHLITWRKMSPSWPASPTAAAPIARFCGETIFPSTPPDELAAASSVGSNPASFAAVTCRTPNSEFDDVSEPVTATPSQPMIGERNGSTSPAPTDDGREERQRVAGAGDPLANGGGLARAVHHIGEAEDRHDGQRGPLEL